MFIFQCVMIAFLCSWFSQSAASCFTWIFPNLCLWQSFSSPLKLKKVWVVTKLNLAATIENSTWIRLCFPQQSRISSSLKLRNKPVVLFPIRSAMVAAVTVSCCLSIYLQQIRVNTLSRVGRLFHRLFLLCLIHGSLCCNVYGPCNTNLY